MCIQRAWRTHFFRVMLQEATGCSFSAVSGRDADSSFGASVASMRLCRATRSEKYSGARGTDDQQTQQQIQKSIYTTRVEAVGLLTAFLRDLQSLFRNKMMKYIK